MLGFGHGCPVDPGHLSAFRPGGTLPDDSVSASAASLPAALPASQRQEGNEVAPLPVETFVAPARGLYVSDILITLWLHRRKLLIAFLVPVLLGLVAALLAPRRYTAESVLLVQATREGSGVQDLTGFMPSTVTVELLKIARAEAEILRSDEVLRAALQQAGPSTVLADASATDGVALDRAVEVMRRAK